MPTSSIRLVLRLLGRTAQDQTARVNAKIKATARDVARVYGMKIPARQFREFFAYDPKPDLAAIRVPVLAITGDKDLQVDHRDLDVIARLVPGPVETHHFPDLTHILRRDPGPASLRNHRQQYRRPVDRRCWRRWRRGSPRTSRVQEHPRRIER